MKQFKLYIQTMAALLEKDNITGPVHANVSRCRPLKEGILTSHPGPPFHCCYSAVPA